VPFSVAEEDLGSFRGVVFCLYHNKAYGERGFWAIFAHSISFSVFLSINLSLIIPPDEQATSAKALTSTMISIGQQCGERPCQYAVDLVKCGN